MTDDAGFDAVVALLQRKSPTLPREELVQRVRQHQETRDGLGAYAAPFGVKAAALERSVTRFWQSPTRERAQTYIQALLPVVRDLRPVERHFIHGDDGLRYPRPERALRFGRYTVDAVLGQGGDGMALRGTDVETGTVVTIKLPARGDLLVWQAIYADREPWSEHVVQVLDYGRPEPPDALLPWVAREYADSTLLDALLPGHLPLASALEVFSAACAGVAWLHAQRIYRWSAHVRNVFRVQGKWKIGDLGRCVAFRPLGDPLLNAHRRDWLDLFGADDEEAYLGAEWLHSYSYWGVPANSVAWAYDADREYRLRLDDCAMLAGLLCDLLARRRWDFFWRAIAKQPFCSAKYGVTGNHTVDQQLSAILNRAWRGDAGGAPLLANAGRGDQSVYSDALELLADVRDALASIAS